MGPWGASCEDRGDLIVSSTERIRHAASDAAVKALILTIAGSHTHAMKLSAMSSLMTSTPNHLPPVNVNKKLVKKWRHERKYIYEWINKIMNNETNKQTRCKNFFFKSIQVYLFSLIQSWIIWIIHNQVKGSLDVIGSSQLFKWKQLIFSQQRQKSAEIHMTLCY